MMTTIKSGSDAKDVELMSKKIRSGKLDKGWSNQEREKLADGLHYLSKVLEVFPNSCWNLSGEIHITEDDENDETAGHYANVTGFALDMTIDKPGVIEEESELNLKFNMIEELVRKIPNDSRVISGLTTILVKYLDDQEPSVVSRYVIEAFWPYMKDYVEITDEDYLKLHKMIRQYDPREDTDRISSAIAKVLKNQVKKGKAKKVWENDEFEAHVGAIGVEDLVEEVLKSMEVDDDCECKVCKCKKCEGNKSCRKVEDD